MESIKTNFQNIGKSTFQDKKLAKKATGWAWSIFRFLLLAGLAFSLLYPIMYMFSMAFKARIDVSDITVKWIPKHFTIENLTRVIEAVNYVPALVFSFVVSFVCALLSAISGSLTGYGLARFKFKGQGFLMVFLLITIIVPATFYSMPSYVLFNEVGLLDNPLSLILPAALAAGIRGGLYVYIFRQFYHGLPKELEEAARIDGCGNFMTYIKIAIPSSIPVFITAFLFAFVWYWNDYQLTRLFIQDFKGIQTLSSSLSNLQVIMKTAFAGVNESEYVNGGQYALDAQAASMLVLGPLLVLYVFLQRYFVESIQRSGLAGD